MRPNNAIDFWRGLALAMIFVNHIPGNVFAYATLRNFAIVDAAEVFVFLAGWSLFHATGGAGRPESWRRVWFRLISRAIQLYRAHLVTSVMALAMIAAIAMARSNPLYYDWINAGPAFSDPQAAYVGLVLLTFQLGYFNILPLYVVLLVMAPVFILIARRSPGAALALSLAIYLAALVTRIIPPAWPDNERWYFNPFSWQILLVLGILAARASSANSADGFHRLAHRLQVPAVAVLAAGLVVTRWQLYPDPLLVPEPRLFFLFDKTYESPARIISLLALVIAFHRLYDWLGPRITAIADYLCRLGRNSLAVFSVGSLLSLVGQIVRFLNDGAVLADVTIIVAGLGMLGFTAWFVEWRERLPSGLSVSRSS